LFLLFLCFPLSSALSSTPCSIQYTFLAYADSTFYLLHRAGWHCSGASVLEVHVTADSVIVSRQPGEAEVEDYARYRKWDELDYDRGVSKDLSLPRYECTIAAPDWAEGTDPATVRLPVVRGIAVEPLYVDGCGRYFNYYLTDAFLDLKSSLLIVLTRSDWMTESVGYDLNCSPGDGFIVYSILDNELDVVEGSGPVLVEVLIDTDGNVSSARLLRGDVSPEEEARILDQARQGSSKPSWRTEPYRRIIVWRRYPGQ